MKNKVNIRKYMPLYLMMLPGVIYLLINNYLPMTGLIIAFKNVNFQKGILASEWVGLDNFKYLFASSDAWLITRNTILYNVSFIILNLVISVGIAILLSQVRSKKGVKFYQSAVLLPYLLSYVIVSYLVYAFIGNDGFINGLLQKAGLHTVSFYSESKYWPLILIFVNTWKSIGYYCVIYMASIIGFDKTYYEAAELDGAGKLQQIRYITLPLLKTTMITMTLLSVGRIFYSDFGLFYQVTKNSGAIFNTTSVIDTYVYNGLIKLGDVGMSSAAGAYQSLVGFCIILVANAITRKISRDDALF